MALATRVIHAQSTSNAVYAELERIQDNRTALHSIIAPPWVSAPNMRGTSSILYSCLLTLFACIYTALHLNVPPRGAGATYVLLKKCLWGFAALITPELVLFYTSGQFFEAKNLAKYLRNEEKRQQLERQQVTNQQPISDKATVETTPVNPSIAATTTTTPIPVGDSTDKSEFEIKYGFFVSMGGLEIIGLAECSENPGGRGTVSAEGVATLARRNIDAVKISRSSIDDRSKADILQKGLVLLQITWMALQCIARKAYGLPITLLELHTMVHVVCAFSMYTFWLEKPLDVKSAEILDGSKFGDVALDERHFHQRGTNLPGLKLSWVLAGDIIRVSEGLSAVLTAGLSNPILITSTIFLPLVYGSVHLSAWDFEFPTPIEGLLWKISGIVIATTFPAWIVLGAVRAGTDACVRTLYKYTETSLALLGRALMYAVALCRIYIVVEAFVSLPAVPIGVYWTPAWIQMIPHV
ncbi:hypothetical protein B0T14DRAFT_570310 [Immersiella caudata]|uniref:Uncharacterized protein n=1 Tax=Immersiella caudata TaxID=314043 RepID=A0AA39WFD6_9PEZI|nr:hypothetical protein B0T14DRAFT_570310 [Immersiella caudata]